MAAGGGGMDDLCEHFDSLSLQEEDGDLISSYYDYQDDLMFVDVDNGNHGDHEDEDKDLRMEQEKADRDLAAELQEEEDRDLAVRLSEQDFQQSGVRTCRRDRDFCGFSGVFPLAQPHRKEPRREGRRQARGGRQLQGGRNERLVRARPGVDLNYGDGTGAVSAVFSMPSERQPTMFEQVGTRYIMQLFQSFESLEGLSDDPYEAYWQMIEMIGEEKDRGMSEEDIASLPSSRAGDTPPQGDSASLTEQCKICLSEVEVGETLRTLPCRHEYHAECIDRWIKQNAVCPTCRSDVKEEMKKGR